MLKRSMRQQPEIVELASVEDEVASVTDQASSITPTASEEEAVEQVGEMVESDSAASLVEPDVVEASTNADAEGTEVVASESSVPESKEEETSDDAVTDAKDSHAIASDDPAADPSPVATENETPTQESTTEVQGEEAPMAPKRPWLGVRMQQPEPTIILVYPNSGAAATKIAVGDTIAAIGDKEVTTTNELVTALGERSASETIDVTVVRGEERLKFQIYLGEARPEAKQIETKKISEVTAVE